MAAIEEKAAVVRKKTGKLVSMMEKLVPKPTSCNESFLEDLMTSVALNEQETNDVLEWGREAGLPIIEEGSSTCLNVMSLVVNQPRSE